MIRFSFFVIFLCCTLLSVNCFSQQKSDVFSSLRKREAKFGNVEIQQSAEVEQLMLSYISSAGKRPGTDGYRVQIYFDTGKSAKQEAENVRAKILTEYPNEKVSLEFDEPYWRVRVGYFRHKHEAVPLMRRLRYLYPNGFIVKVSNIKPENFGL